MRPFLTFFVALAISVQASAFVTDDAPAWGRAACVATDKAFAGEAPLVYRLVETIATVGADGYCTFEYRYVAEITRQNGDDRANDVESYCASTDKVLEAKGWLVRGGKVIQSKDKSEWDDSCELGAFEAFNDSRRIRCDFKSKAVTGDFVIFQCVIRQKLPIPNILAPCVGAFTPCVSQIVRITVPAGWTLVHRGTSSTPPYVYQNTGSTHVLILPAAPYETWEDGSYTVPKAIALTLRSPNNEIPAISDWRDVGVAVDALSQGQNTCTADLKGKVTALTASCRSQWEKIAALARHAQQVRYVSINKNLGLGHGMRPRAAGEVFKTGYGDCKDKANYLCTMLGEIGVTAHLVFVNVFRGMVLDQNAPDPAWFNHAITAIQVEQPPAEWRDACVVDGEKTYLIFDPTDPDTVLGDIPGNLQDIPGFLNTASTGHLVRLPAIPSTKSFSTARSAKLVLAKDGSIQGSFSIEKLGQTATYARSYFNSSATAESTERYFRSTLNETFKSATLKSQDRSDDATTGVMKLRFDADIPQYLQPLPGGKAIAKLELFSRGHYPVLPEATRTKPIYLEPLVMSDEIEVDLQGYYEAAELPKGAKLQSAFGDYSLAVSKSPKGISVKRVYEQRRKIVSPEDYPKLKQFLSSVLKSDRSTAVLKAVIVPPAAGAPTASSAPATH